MASERKYTLTLNEKQASVLQAALEAYARLKHGQIDMVIGDAFMDRKYDRQAVRLHADTIKKQVFPELHPNASYGVGARVYPESTTAWDMMQVVRHRLAWDRLADEGKSKPDYYGVHYNEPMRFGTEPLAKIEEVKE